MLRPATPLTILFFAAFALLLLSVLSTPIIKAIPLATFQGVDFGVFGYCQGNKCSGIRIGYNPGMCGFRHSFFACYKRPPIALRFLQTQAALPMLTKYPGKDGLFTNAANDDFSLPSTTRHTVSSLLIVHPIAAFLTLICFALAAAAHFHAPSHSPRYLLGLLILSFPTLLISLLAFLVDVLLFNPHMQWGSWIVLAATIIITACGVVTCAMRRTLVSRKARQKRIAENADMNGTTFYNNNNAQVREVLPKADSPPPLSSGHSMSPGEKMPDFATFDVNQKKSDDRAPLNPANSSMLSGSTTAVPGAVNGFSDGESTRYGDPGRMGPPGPGGRRPPPPRDQYGNPIPGYGPPSLRHQGSNGTMGSNRSGGPPPFYGRGRGGPPRGPMRGGFGPRGGFRGGPRGPPPPGWNGGGRGGMGGPPPGPMMGRGQRGPPPGYDHDILDYYGQPPPQGSRDVSPGPYGAPRAVSPLQPMGMGQDQGPVGQAMAMDQNGGIPQGAANYGLRDSDADVQGMIALQQPQRISPDSERRDSTPLSPTSEYSAQRESDFVPARANWVAPGASGLNNSSGSLQNVSNNSRGLSPIQHSPVELPAGRSPNPNQHKRTGSSDYYEDVDPRFAQDEPLPARTGPDSHDTPLPTAGLPSSTILPTALVPGGGYGLPKESSSQPPALQTTGHLDPNGSYEDIADGSRSPAASEASHFTSVSQRPVNPNWNPPPQPNPAYTGAGYGSVRRNDRILEENPDFTLPAGRGGFNGRGRGRGMRGDPGAIGPGGMGRYPNAI
jgi:hypothetical protein